MSDPRDGDDACDDDDKAHDHDGLVALANRMYPVEERPFADAWCRAIDCRVRYQKYFHGGFNLDRLSYRKHAPMVAVIKGDLHELASSDAIFLAALVSFYNGDAGGRMLRGLGAPGLSDVAASLDQERREILAELIVNYCGW